MAIKKLDFKVPFLDADGVEVKEGEKPILLSKQLSDALMLASTKEPVKYFDWALELRKSGQLTLDQTDKDNLKAFVKDREGFTVLWKGRILEVIG
jgi:hypothetical protein